MTERTDENGPMMFHKGTENELLKYVLENAKTGDAQSVIDTIDKFCWNFHWMMHVGDEKGKILSDEVKKSKPLNVLELGTYCGYSTIRIAMNIPDNGKVYTIDPNRNLIESVTKKLIEKAGLSNKVVFLNGYSDAVISTLNSSTKFDLVFLDHDKKRYYPDLLLLESNGLLNPGCTLVADNVIVFNINDYYNYVKQKYPTTVHNTHLEYDNNSYEDGVIISKIN